jgi:hypothetical protein
MTEVLLDDGHCVNECPAGFYISENRTNYIETNICLPCLIGCKKCVSPNRCMECDGSKEYTLKDQNCIPKCKSGYDEIIRIF